MKNIYDIITEQSGLVNVNIASYDLDYTINTINNSSYLQEGFGDVVKSGAKKVVEFIKMLIEKLKNLFSKIMNFLFKSGNRGIKKLEAVKKSAGGSNTSGDKNNNNKPSGSSEPSGGSGNNNSGNANAKYFDLNSIKNINPDDLTPEHILAGSSRPVNVIPYVHLETKRELISNFNDGVHNTTGNYVSNENAKEIKQVFINSIEKKVFKGDGSFKTMKGDNISIADRVHAELKEPKEPKEIIVKNIPKDIFMSYIYANIDPKTGKEGQLAEYFKKLDEISYKELNILKSRVEKNVNEQGEKDEASYANVQAVISMVGSFLNYMSTNIFKAYNTYDRLLSIVAGDYDAALRANK